MQDFFKKTIQERYASSSISSDLTDDAHHHALDVVAAVAMAGGIGGLLYRVKYALDASSYPQLRTAWHDLIIETADKRHWPTNINLRRLSSITLDYWINDRCGDCNALGFGKFANAPMLTGDVCVMCDGTGTRPFTCDSTMRRYAIDSISNLECIASEAGAAARRKLYTK